MKYLKTCDFAPAMVWHSRFLQVMEQTNKPTRWLLKDPTHVHHIPELLSAYPGAYFVFIHRNPTATIPSLCSLSSKITSALSTRADKEEIGENLLDYWGCAIEKNLMDRAQIPETGYLIYILLILFQTPWSKLNGCMLILALS